MRDALMSLLVKNWVWPLLSLLGGALISRLWLWWRFKSRARDFPRDKERMQKSYNSLCYISRVGSISHKVTCYAVPDLGFNDIRWALKIGKWSWFSQKAATALRNMEKILLTLQEQPNYLEMENKQQAVTTYKSNMRKLMVCWMMADELTKWRYSTLSLSSDETAGEELDAAYGFITSEQEAMDLFLKAKGVHVMTELETKNYLLSLGDEE